MAITAVIVSALVLAPAGAESAHDHMLNVPTVFASIQLAIDAAHDGNVITVDAGAYQENIDFKGKAIVLRSRSGPDLTTIDGGFAGPVVTFQSSEGPQSVLDGFTITHGGAAASGAAGGIWCHQAAPTVINNIITLNDGDSHGGAISCIDASPFIGGNELSANSSYASGGAIHCSQSSAVIDGNTITSNSAEQDGGAIYSVDALQLIVRGNWIADNFALANGGGIACLRGTVELSHNVFHHNDAFGNGGAISCRACAPTITDNELTLNRTELGAGGGAYLLGVTQASMSANAIEQNSSASYEGAGVYVDRSVVELVDNVIRNNSLGGIACVNQGEVTLRRCEITGNSAITGGGVLIRRASPALFDCVIADNEATDSGGGLHADQGSITLVNCLLVNNRARYLDGGGCCFLDATPTLIACTVADNHADDAANQRGGGVCLLSSRDPGSFAATIVNSIIWQNHAAVGREIFSALPSLSVSYSNVGDGWAGDHNLALNPRFANDGSYQLSARSPCVNGGNPAVALPDHDLFGDPRVAFGLPDIGADEYYTTLSILNGRLP